MNWFAYELPGFLLFRGFLLTSLVGRVLWIALYPIYLIVGIFVYALILVRWMLRWTRTKTVGFSDFTWSLWRNR